jgi:hypothetical protein
MERAKALSPRDPRVYLWRFWEAMIHVRRREWERAKAACRESIDAQKRNVPAWLTLISVLVAEGERDAAVRASEELKGMEPTLDEPRLRRILGMGVDTNPRFVENVVGIYRDVGLV